MLRSSLLRTRSFFSLPTRTTSTASNRSFWLTAFLPFLTARIAASLIMFARSEPTAPAVASAIACKSTVSSRETFLACTFKISTRPFRSGRSTMTRRSKRPGRRRAGSSTSGRLVAARIKRPLEVSIPSISESSWFNVCCCSDSPPPVPPLLLRPMESISSMKIMQGEFCCACLKRLRTREAPTPTYISMKSEPDRKKNGTFASPATALASSVLPVPGGPTSRAPFGSFAPIWVYFPGLCRKSTSSTRDSFASSSPATSANVTPVSFCMYILAVLFPTPPMRFIMKFIMTTISTNGRIKLSRDSIMAMLSWRSLRISTPPASSRSVSL